MFRAMQRQQSFNSLGLNYVLGWMNKNELNVI